MLDFVAFLMQADTSAPQMTGGQAAVTGAMIGISLGVMIVMIAAMWKLFTKAGEPGWAAIVPIYNILVLLKIVGKPMWWIVLFLIPFVNMVMALIIPFAVAKSFNKGGGFGVGLLFLPFVFYPVLAWGSAQYTPQPQPA